MHRAVLPLRGNRGEKKSTTKQEQINSTGSIEKSSPGRTMSSRSAVIVPKTGELRPSNLTDRGTLTYKSRRKLPAGRAAPGERIVGGKDAEHSGVLG